MEIRVLRYFLTVAREESITKASEVLHITQPTLSRQLRELEEEVGVKLFQRGTRKISLTQEGLLLRRRAEEIIDLTDKTAQELLEQEKELDGRVSIGCGEMNAIQELADLCGAFRKMHPLVTFDFYTAAADAVRERMDRGLLDAGLLLDAAGIEKYEVLLLQKPEQWCVLLRPDDVLAEKEGISAKDLQSLPLILPPRLGVQSHLTKWFGKGFDKLHVAYTGSLTANSAVLAAKGLGYALVLDNSLPFTDPTKLISRPLFPAVSTDVMLAWKRGRPLSPVMEKFADFLRKQATHA